MSGYDRLRWAAVALLVVAGVLNAVGNSHHERGLQALSLALFLGAVFLFLGWRRARLRRRRGNRQGQTRV